MYYSDKLGIKLYTGAALIIVSAASAITLMCAGITSDINEFSATNLQMLEQRLKDNYGQNSLNNLDVIDDNKELLKEFKSR